MAEQFIVPKEPALHWTMLLPRFRRNENYFRQTGNPVHYLFWARNGIYHGLAALGIKPGDNVLVPAYHCTSLVEPILRYGGEAKFYDVGLDLTPNFDDLKKRIDPKTRAILAIHYFGFPQPIRKFRELCQARGLYLIEDCAHVLNGSTHEGIALGESGDISIFSWRKFLPLYDGGQLVINNPNLTINVPLDKGGFLLSLKICKNTFERLFPSSPDGGHCLSVARKLLSSLARHFEGLNRSTERALHVNSYEIEFNLGSINLGMSSISKHILKSANIAEVVKRRRRNYEQLRDAAQSMKGVTVPYPTIPETICPWVFPLIVHDIEDFHVRLRSHGIPASTWGGVIHPTLRVQDFPAADYLYRRLIMLPIHQSIDDRALKAMVEILARLF